MDFDDERAVAWDLTGAICHLFGWRRARELFRQMHRYIFGAKGLRKFAPHPEITAMAALQDYNDDDETTYNEIMEHIRGVPIWRRPSCMPRADKVQS